MAPRPPVRRAAVSVPRQLLARAVDLPKPGRLSPRGGVEDPLLDLLCDLGSHTLRVRSVPRLGHQ